MTPQSSRERRFLMRSRTCVHPHDVVRLTRAAGDWPRGTEGTVVAEHNAYLVVEVGEEAAPDVIDVPREDLRVIWSPAGEVPSR